MFAKRLLRSFFACALLMFCLIVSRPAGAQNITSIRFGLDPVVGGTNILCIVYLSAPAPAGGEWIYMYSMHPEFASFSTGGDTWLWAPPGYGYAYTVLYTHPVPSRRIDLIRAVPWGSNLWRGDYLTLLP